MKEVRQKGYTYEYNEAVEGMVCIAGPVRDHRGEVIAAAGITYPLFKTEEGKIKEAIRLVTETATEISLSLGFPDITRKGEKSSMREVPL